MIGDMSAVKVRHWGNHFFQVQQGTQNQES